MNRNCNCFELKKILAKIWIFTNNYVIFRQISANLKYIGEKIIKNKKFKRYKAFGRQFIRNFLIRNSVIQKKLAEKSFKVTRVRCKYYFAIIHMPIPGFILLCIAIGAVDMQLHGKGAALDADDPAFIEQISVSLKVCLFGILIRKKFEFRK